MESEQRWKRKRTPKPLYSPSRLFSVRSLILCLAFLAFIYYLLSDRIPITPSAFRPVLVVSSLSLLSSSSSSNSIRDDYENAYSQAKLKIDDRVLFPDHVLLIVSNSNVLVKNSDEFECVYVKFFSSSTDTSIIDDNEIVSFGENVSSMDEFDDFRSIFRCPLPPENYSAVVNLRRRRRGRDEVNLDGSDVILQSNRTVQNWENLAYESKLDGETVVVFVKGLNLRSNRKSDYRQFSCHFGLGNSNEKFAFRTKAISAAQEVVRCSLPKTIQINPNRAQGIRVTVGVSQNLHDKAHEHVLVPSVAKIFNSKTEVKKKKNKNLGKYELCVCTMVWNQASSLREWIMYHSWLGIEKWFIYDNNSDDAIKDVIQELEQENYNVTRHVWPWIKTQEAGFSHCALRSREECNWVGFMDVDEFFYLRQNFKKFGFPGQNSLRDLVSNFSSSPRIGEIRTACHSFGPSGLRSPPSRGVTVGYTCRIRGPERHKSIVRPDALDITLLNVVHHFRLRKGFEYLNLRQSRGSINHYKYQVWEAFRAKFFRRVATYVADWKENQKEGSRDRAPGLGTEAIEPANWPLQFCEVWDTGLRDTVLAKLADPTTGLLPWESRNYLM